MTNAATLHYRIRATLNLLRFIGFGSHSANVTYHKMLDEVFVAFKINTYRALTMCQALF